MSSSDHQLDSPALVWNARLATFCTWKCTLRAELDAGTVDLNDRTTEVELDGVGLGAMALRRAGTMDRVAERANMVCNSSRTISLSPRSLLYLMGKPLDSEM
jgi:hypothetical protein